MGEAKKALDELPVLVTDTLCQKCGATKSTNGGDDGGFTAYNISETPDPDDGVFNVTDCNRCKERIQ